MTKSHKYSKKKIVNTVRFSRVIKCSRLLIVYDHLDIISKLAGCSVGLFLVQASKSISYTKNAMPFTGKARKHNSVKPWKKRPKPPCRYVCFIQSHEPLYNGFVRLSATIFDLITSNGNTKIQLITPGENKLFSSQTILSK